MRSQPILRPATSDEYGGKERQRRPSDGVVMALISLRRRQPCPGGRRITLAVDDTWADRIERESATDWPRREMMVSFIEGPSIVTARFECSSRTGRPRVPCS